VTFKKVTDTHLIKFRWFTMNLWHSLSLNPQNEHLTSVVTVVFGCF